MSTPATRHMSLEDRIEAYFKINQFEELSAPDMALKFGASESAVVTAISRLRMRGLDLERVSIYRLKSVDDMTLVGGLR